MKIKLLNFFRHDIKDSLQAKKIIFGILIASALPILLLITFFIVQVITLGSSLTHTYILHSFEEYLYQTNLVVFGGIIIPLLAAIFGANAVAGYGPNIKVIFSKPVNRSEMIISKFISFMILALISITGAVLIFSITYSIMTSTNIFLYEWDIILTSIFSPLLPIAATFCFSAMMATVLKKKGASIAISIIYFLVYPFMIYSILNSFVVLLGTYSSIFQGSSVFGYSIFSIVFALIRFDFYYSSFLQNFGRYSTIALRVNSDMFSITSSFGYDFPITIDPIISIVILAAICIITMLYALSRISSMDVLD